MSSFSIAALAGSLTLCVCAQAVAQQASADNTQAAAPAPSYNAGADNSKWPLGNQTAMTGQDLLDRGIAVSSSITMEPAANPIGGINQGATYAGQFYFGVDLDLAKMIAANDTYAHFAINDRQGGRLSDEFIGSSIGSQEIYGLQTFHLTLATLEHKFFNGRLDVTVGRSPANIYFLESPIYCHFMNNSTCGNPSLIYFASNFPWWPTSAWSGDAKYWLTSKIYAHAGIWDIDPRDAETVYPVGELSAAHATGVTMPFEIGYATSFKNDDLPRHYQVGGWVDRSSYTSPLYSADGGFAALNGQPYAMEFGRSGVWARFDQMVWRPDPHSNRGLTVFGVFMDALSGQPVMQQYYELGLLQQGTFAGRDNDTVGLVVNVERWSSYAIDNIRLARASVGSFTPPPSYMVMTELNYGLQLTPAVQFSPNIQAIINPDNINEPTRRNNIPDAFIVGFKLNVDLGILAGIPSIPVSEAPGEEAF